MTTDVRVTDDETTDDDTVEPPEPDQPKAPDPDGASRPNGWPRRLFACWVGLNAALVIWLAVWNAMLTRSAWDLIGSLLLIGIGISCVLAFALTVFRPANAALTSVVSQIFVACLAVYVWLVDQQSPISQLFGITGVALAIGAIAIVWVLYLARYVKGAGSKSATVAVALFPLLGLFQFWLQTDYLPTASRPPIDVTAELTPIGSTGPIIHVLAKVTLHNRGSVQADFHAGLMRVTADPVNTETEPPTADALRAGLGPIGSAVDRPYREVPARVADSRLIFADMLAAPHQGAFIAPGGTSESQAIVDVDSRTVRLVRLSVRGVVTTDRLMQETYSCTGDHSSFQRNPVSYLSEVNQLTEWLNSGVRVICSESRFAPRSAIEALVFDRPVVRTLVVVDQPAHTVEMPTLFPYFGTADSVQNPFGPTAVMNKVENSNPTELLSFATEYAPSDADVRGGRG